MSSTRWRIAWQLQAQGDAYPSPYRQFRTLVGPETTSNAATWPGAGGIDGLPALVAQELREVADALDAAGRASQPVTLVDVGAADAHLLHQVAAVLSARDPELLARAEFVAVDQRAPEFESQGLPGAPEIRWVTGDATDARLWRDAFPQGVVGMIVANEFLDDIPVEVAVRDGDDWRYVEVSASGHEQPGEVVEESDRDWITRWWPGSRSEVGAPRDAAARLLAEILTTGRVTLIDYGHLLAERITGRWDSGTLVGYRAGTAVAPAPDGSMNLTAHVAFDSVAAGLSELGRVRISTLSDELGNLGSTAVTDAGDQAPDETADAGVRLAGLLAGRRQGRVSRRMLVVRLDR